MGWFTKTPSVALNEQALMRSLWRLPGAPLQIVLAILASSLLLGTCSATPEYHDQIVVAPGDTVEIKEKFNFYFNRPEEINNVVVIPEQYASLIVEDAKWEVPKGFTLRQVNLQVTRTEFSYDEGSFSHTVQGYRLVATLTITIQDGATLGYQDLRVILPNLDEVSTILKAEPVFPEENGFAAPHTLTVKSFEVKTQAAREHQTIIYRVLVIGIVLILLSLWIHDRMKKRVRT
jgi:hypothetical protein